ncbi:MAG: site-specific tyrosine recombinase/integron integrase [Clostridium sp.]|uniref:site-specific tyrosine recombinase/integron integrase n=1 Tax=Clostridium sp. TaxID=1506 RepID=UPI003D6D6130
MSIANNEIIIRLVGKLTLEFPDIDQLKVRMIAEEVLYKYDVVPQEVGLVTSDIEDRLMMYFAVKKLDGLSMKTLKGYKYQLMIFARYLNKPIAAVTTTDLRMYLANRCKNLKPGSTNTQISTLKSFFGWLFDEEYIPKNPMSKIKSTKEPKRLRHALSQEELELLRQATKKDREKALLEFLISTGCRLSEVVGVNKDDIDWYEMSLFVIGKGNKERKVYFSIKAKILLKKYISTRKDCNQALFVASKGTHNRLGGRSIENEIKKIAVRAGIDKSVFPHLFRHSYATHNLNSGMSLPVLQHLMGHEDSATTMIYAELSEENVKHEYKKIS